MSLKTKRIDVNLKKKKLRRGVFNAFRKGDQLCVLQWKNKRDIDDTKSGAHKVIQKPSVVCRYNENMSGVDVANHYIAIFLYTLIHSPENL